VKRIFLTTSFALSLRATAHMGSSLPAGRRAVGFGNQKINLQLLGQEPRNRAQVGSGDVCLITRWPLEQVMAQLACHGVEIVEGPVTKSGACGPIESVYFLDPDQNLIEVSIYP